MFEKIFAWMLRLYPARFRRHYGAQSLQLLRDRARDERGFARRLRLWSDLLADLAVSLPREYCRVFFVPLSEPEPLPAGGTPMFALLESGPPRTRSMLFGCVLSLMTLACFPALMNQFGVFRPSVAWISGFQRVAEGDSSPQRFRPPSPADAQAAAMVPPSASVTLDRAMRHRIISGAISYLNQHTSDAAVAKKAAAALLARERNGDDDAATTPADLAHLLTLQIREATDDHDVEMLYSARPIPERPHGAFPPALPAAYREEMLRSNCGFEKIEVLPDNIGYIKLDAFGARSVCESIAIAAMKRVNDTDALIFDLRDNHGGFDLGGMLASYLFDHPVYWYSPIQDTTRDSWTQSPVQGSKLAGKSVYILTSSQTISAAEQFAYNLKMLKRATLVGETTAGGAHAANFHPLGDNFYLGTVDVKSINPYSKHDWNGTGIEPDVKVSAADAFNTALKLAHNRRGR